MTDLRSSLSAFPFPVAPQTLAGQFDAMGVVNEAVQDGVGVCRVRYDLMPAVHGKLGGDDRRETAIALFEDFEQIVTGGGVERLQAPVVEYQQVGATETAQDAGMTPVPARQRQFLEQPGNALVENRP